MKRHGTKKLILLGAGKLGRSFMGILFSRSGYEVAFVDNYRTEEYDKAIEKTPDTKWILSPFLCTCFSKLIVEEVQPRFHCSISVLAISSGE
jgi:hypothetical protein